MKTRIIVTIFALVLVVGLYFLPRTVVENEQSTEIPGASRQETKIDISRTPLVSGSSDQINRLADAIKNEQNKEKFIIFADSLAIAYREVGWLDSAAYYKGLIANRYPSLEYNVEAGNSWYDAFSTAQDAAAAREWGAKARKYFERAIAVDSSLVDAQVKVAMTLTADASPMQGILMLRTIADEHPDNVMAQYHLGLFSMQTNQMDKAMERFSKVVEIEPDNLMARYFLGNSALEAGNRDLARKQFNWLVENSNDPEVAANAEQQLKKLN